MMINNVSLVGRLTKDPELRYTQTGVAVARFTLAVNRAFSNQQGEKDADFITCVAWRKTAESLANFMRKGSQVGVTGRIQTGSYDDKDGKRVYTTEVVANEIAFLEPKSEQPQQQYQQPQQPQQQYQQPMQTPQTPQTPPMQQTPPQYQQPQQYDYSPVSDDDLPF